MAVDQNSYSKSGMFTFVVSMVASFGILIYVSFLSGGVDLKELPQEKAKTEAGAPAVAPTDPNTTADAPAEAAPDVKTPEASPTPDAKH